ncbi:hypothetical protein ACIBHY_29965 [Nonomuraea sp. NPDC050547]|uniref:hypothetical protein n=1 Tax=Nonomuraea sp. NPDC050547 TaxID=3364368 RepID=UPI0037B97D70
MERHDITTAVAEELTHQAIAPDYAYALLLLTQGHKVHDAVAATGIIYSRLVSLARQQALHAVAERATYATRDEFTPVLTSELHAIAAT